MNKPILYALDFDGVICDSVVETAITGWKAAALIWGDMPLRPEQAQIEQFRAARPIVETGYESILVMRLIFRGFGHDEIFGDYTARTQGLIAETQRSIADLKQLFGDIRDQWIAEDRADWIAQNPLYPGMAEKLRRLGMQSEWYIVTTKQERFVKKLLKANDIDLADSHIYGLDRNLSKPEILKILVREHQDRQICFIEDRIQALLKAQQEPELAGIQLKFAPWGYNDEHDKTLAKQHGFEHLDREAFISS
jgi:phosphoglycolate phosphatase-like HAD superfamily hydrolase